MNKEILHKEIDLIQSIISRMETNSFFLKGWIVSLIAAVLALTKDTIVINNMTYFGLILCVPVLSFWYLDAFYLHKQKCYRRLYDWVIQNRVVSSEFLYSLDYTRFENKVDGIIAIMFSKTLFPFYTILIIFLFGISIFNILNT